MFILNFKTFHSNLIIDGCKQAVFRQSPTSVPSLGTWRVPDCSLVERYCNCGISGWIQELRMTWKMVRLLLFLSALCLLEFCHVFQFYIYLSGGTSGVTFEIGGESQSQANLSGPGPDADDDNWQGWDCVWKCRTATPVFHMAFSPDGTLFATSGKCDRLVKIWFENKQCMYSFSIFFATLILYAMTNIEHN